MPNPSQQDAPNHRRTDTGLAGHRAVARVRIAITFTEAQRSGLVFSHARIGIWAGLGPGVVGPFRPLWILSPPMPPGGRTPATSADSVPRPWRLRFPLKVPSHIHSAARRMHLRDFYILKKTVFAACPLRLVGTCWRRPCSCGIHARHSAIFGDVVVIYPPRDTKTHLKCAFFTKMWCKCDLSDAY